ncbi:anti-sigma factor antagonist [Streptomyces californicus]|uniref:anti-sigma factor antagonist n=1 Tax=Streptomyces californicus TaxID=67351 RepID=UPI0033FE53F4
MHRTDSYHHGLRIQHTLYPTAYLLRLAGDTDSTGSEVAAAFHHAAAWELPLIVDLSALGFGDGELLRHLLHAYQDGLTLVGPVSDSFQHRLDTTGVTDLFTIRPTLHAALDSPGHPRL